MFYNSTYLTYNRLQSKHLESNCWKLVKSYMIGIRCRECGVEVSHIQHQNRLQWTPKNKAIVCENHYNPHGNKIVDVEGRASALLSFLNETKTFLLLFTIGDFRMFLCVNDDIKTLLERKKIHYDQIQHITETSEKVRITMKDGKKRYINKDTLTEHIKTIIPN